MVTVCCDSPLPHDEFRRFIWLLRREWRLEILQLSNHRHASMVLATNQVEGKVEHKLVRNSKLLTNFLQDEKQ